MASSAFKWMNRLPLLRLLLLDLLLGLLQKVKLKLLGILILDVVAVFVNVLMNIAIHLRLDADPGVHRLQSVTPRAEMHVRSRILCMCRSFLLALLPIAFGC